MEKTARLGELQGQLGSVDRERQSWQADRRLLLRGLALAVAVALIMIGVVVLLSGAGG